MLVVIGIHVYWLYSCSFGFLLHESHCQEPGSHVEIHELLRRCHLHPVDLGKGSLEDVVKRMVSVHGLKGCRYSGIVPALADTLN